MAGRGRGNTLETTPPPPPPPVPRRHDLDTKVHVAPIWRVYGKFTSDYCEQILGKRKLLPQVSNHFDPRTTSSLSLCDFQTARIKYHYITHVSAEQKTTLSITLTVLLGCLQK